MRLVTVSALGSWLLALSATATAQTVWIVDDDGPADFADLPAAVSAAGEGDLLLVRDGLYSELAINGKSLTIQADAGHRPEVSELQVGNGSGQSVVQVGGLAAGQEVYLRGLDIGGTYFQSFSRTPFITLTNNAGEVWIEDCELVMDLAQSGFTGIRATNCAAVHVARCVLTAAQASPPTYGDGIDASGSHLTVWDSSIHAGPGFFGLGAPAPGGRGIHVLGGSLFLSGCEVVGGDGGDNATADFGASGGDGLLVEGGALVRSRDTTFTGGAGGQGTVGTAPAGLPTNVVAGTLVPIGGPAKSFDVGSPARVGVDPVVTTYAGQPGDVVVLMWSHGQMAPFWFAFEHGSFAIALNGLEAKVAGVIGPSGFLVNPIPPVAAIGGDVANLPCQAVFFQPGSGWYMSGPSLLTLVGPGL